MQKLLVPILFLFSFFSADAQDEPIVNPAKPKANPTKTNNNAFKRSGATDTIGFEHRDDAKDSISITYRYLDSTRRNPMDSSVNDFDNYFYGDKRVEWMKELHRKPTK